MACASASKAVPNLGRHHPAPFRASGACRRRGSKVLADVATCAGAQWTVPSAADSVRRQWRRLACFLGLRRHFGGAFNSRWGRRLRLESPRTQGQAATGAPSTSTFPLRGRSVLRRGRPGLTAAQGGVAQEAISPATSVAAASRRRSSARSWKRSARPMAFACAGGPPPGRRRPAPGRKPTLPGGRGGPPPLGGCSRCPRPNAPRTVGHYIEMGETYESQKSHCGFLRSEMVSGIGSRSCRYWSVAVE
jgi:hypothetical protein